MLQIFHSSPRKSAYAMGFLSSFLLLFLIIFLQAMNRQAGIAKQKSSALGATVGVDWNNPYSLWASPRLVDAVFPMRPMVRSRNFVPMLMQVGVNDPATEQRKIARTGMLWLSVNDPIRAIDEITGIAQQYGGYAVNQQSQTRAVTGEEGELTLRVPADKFDEVRARIKGRAVHVDEERAVANDVTKDYFDFEARLRSLHAQEEQYLQILKSAKTVEDTLSVTEKLSDVRGQIERAQGEFNFLQKTVETSLIEVHLQSVPGGRFAGFDWHPGMRFKSELRDGIEAVGDFAGALLAILVRLPAILLWGLTITGICALAWRIGRRLWKWLVPAQTASLRA